MKIERGGPSARSKGDYSIKQRLAFIERHVSLKGKRILDVGCGNGFYTVEMAKKSKEVVGVDINKKFVDEAIRHSNEEMVKNVSFSCSPIGSYDTDEQFDVITLIEVLEHVDDELLVLRKLHRLLKNDGQIILFVPNRWYPFETHGANIFGYVVNGWKGSVPLLSWAPDFVRQKFCRARIYTKKSIKKILCTSGFDIIRIGYFPPPLDLLGNGLFLKHVRKLFLFMNDTPLRIFFMSLFVIAVKSENR